MTRWQRLGCTLAPVRWWRSALALLRGVRLHPSAVLLGDSRRAAFGRGVVVGREVRIDLGRDGRLWLGPGAWLAASTEIETGSMLRIGAGTSLQRRCSINGDVRLGRGCILAPHVFVSSGTHPFRLAPHLPIREQERRLASGELATGVPLHRPVRVQDDCWLGVNVVVCPGVTIGRGSIVGANAVVVRDVPPYSVVAGAPARVVGRRLDWQPPAQQRYEREQDRVYALAGEPQDDALGWDDAGEIVLAVPPEAVRVTLWLRAGAAMALEVQGRRRDVAAGLSSLDGVVPAAHAPAGVRAVVLRRLDAAGATLQVTGLDAQ